MATPPGAYADATYVTRNMAQEGGLSISEPEDMRAYFNRYYQTDLDPNDIEALRAKLDFPQVAERFAMIEDATRAVLVPYNETASALIDQLAATRGSDPGLRRRLQRYQVALRERELAKAREVGAVTELFRGSDIWVCDSRFYSPALGLIFEADGPLIV